MVRVLPGETTSCCFDSEGGILFERVGGEVHVLGAEDESSVGSRLELAERDAVLDAVREIAGG